MKKPHDQALQDVRQQAEQQGIPTHRGDRVLTWHDEFTQPADFDKNWLFRTQMNSTDCELKTDARHVAYEGGQLVMRTFKGEKEGVLYTIPMALTTYDKMVYRRGYLEMRAKIPFRHGTWPSFWMLTYEPLQEAPMRSEIDIFEVFSSEDSLFCNLHKSQRDPSGSIAAREQLHGKMISNLNYTFPHPEKLNEEYHVYGFDWTRDTMTFLIDDVPYTTIDLHHDFGQKIHGMECYQDYHFVILCDYVFTPGHHWAPEGYLMKPEDPCPVEYHVDWVRLYQKPGEDILIGE